MHEEDDDDVGTLERLIALQRLRIEQVRIHLDSLIPTQFAARQARAGLLQMLEDLRKLERLRGTPRHQTHHHLRVH